MSDEERKKAAVFNHDVFNMLVMAFLVALDTVYLILYTETNKIGTQLVIGESSFARDHFQLIYATFVVYLFVDTIWILVQPICVASKSPATIVFHHFMTIALIALPLIDPRFQWHMAVTLMVETNTLFLAMRRNLLKGTWLHFISELNFYITWFIGRLIMFPLLLVLFSYEFIWHSVRVHTYINGVVLGPLLLGALTYLSFLWTYEIVTKHFMRREGGRSEETIDSKKYN